MLQTEHRCMGSHRPRWALRALTSKSPWFQGPLPAPAPHRENTPQELLNQWVETVGGHDSQLLCFLLTLLLRTRTGILCDKWRFVTEEGEAGTQDMCSGFADLELFTNKSPLMTAFSREVTSACVTVSGRLPATSQHCRLPRGNMCPSTSDLSAVMMGCL